MKNKTILDVCKRFSAGDAIKAKDIKVTGKYPVFGANGIRGYTDTFNFDGQCAVIGRQGAESGNVHYYEGKAYMTEHAIVAEANEENCSGYLAYKLMQMNLARYQGQSAQPGISAKTISELPIDIPDLEYQKLVFGALNNLEKKITNNEAIAHQLEAMAKIIYDYWFLQFEFPNEEGKPYRSSGGKMVWNEELQREIPAGWEVGNISSLIDSKKNGDWGKENMQGNYVLPVSCIRGADLDFVNGKSLSTPPTRFILEKNSSKLLKPYDFVIEISGGSPTQSTGRIAGISPYLFSRFNNEIVCSNFCKAITLKDEVNYYYFLQTWMTLFENDVMFNWEGKTSGIKNLIFDSFVKNTKIVIPNKEQLNMFFEISDGIEKKIQNLLKQNQELVSLRDFLLPLLMNGQVTVGE
ncbi:MAG TPA: restriction endonuclease subunit S [Companilactobacillus farciminis]|uniref:Restriction endonuclease subunit S n=1 Tax=Companilactobacillus farciminis TaxID=1612 RepID=A0A921LAX2_9LACO|nr:restriction endonuclease subunit S [Companilactobacillus farciminis]